MAETKTSCFADPTLESDVRRLYQRACCGAEPLLRQSKDPRLALQDTPTRLAFIRAAHAGFAAAQDEIAHRLVTLEHASPASKWKKSTEKLWRKIMDAVAWQMLSEQLYVARRFYREQRQPRLSESNFQSVAKVAAAIRDKDDLAFALIADLTTFIQTGDLLVVDPSSGLRIIEVKEGSKNKKIMNFAEFFLEAQCERALYYFAQEEGPKAFQQLGRIFRQGERMSHVAAVMNSGDSVDPDTNQRVVVPEEPFQMDTYDSIEGLGDQCCR